MRQEKGRSEMKSVGEVGQECEREKVRQESNMKGVRQVRAREGSRLQHTHLQATGRQA